MRTIGLSVFIVEYRRPSLSETNYTLDMKKEIDIKFFQNNNFLEITLKKQIINKKSHYIDIIKKR